MNVGSTGASARGSRPVVVGVDQSDSARDAAEWAADLAAACNAPLRLVHVGPGVPVGGSGPSSPPWLSELMRGTERAGADTDVVETAGAVVDVLAGQAAEARLLVLGSYGEGAWTGMLAGSVARDLINRAACPVAVVRGAAPQVPPPRSGPVVVGVDGSAASHAALMLAAELAESLGVRLVAMHTWTDVVAGPHGGPRQRSEDDATLAAEGGSLLDSELEFVAAAHPALPTERYLVEDTALRALLDRAGAARLLVVGHQGHREVDGLMLGSTSTRLVEFAPCPVLVVKPSGARGPVGGTRD
ncbi:universal stress protein [Pseudonocardia xinjiangensis]|nr:universal stress protein [Pseudonocardia xinjiangensis]